jgi:hypothetical protein
MLELGSRVHARVHACAQARAGLYIYVSGALESTKSSRVSIIVCSEFESFFLSLSFEPTAPSIIIQIFVGNLLKKDHSIENRTTRVKLLRA